MTTTAEDRAVGALLGLAARPGGTHLRGDVDTIGPLRAGTSKERYDSPEAPSQQDLLRRAVQRRRGG